MKLTTAGKVTKNTIAMTSASLVQRAASFVLYILIARHLGVLIFGKFSLVYSLYFIFQVPAMFGLTSLIVREVAKKKSDFGKYLVNGHLIVLIASLASIGLWALVVYLLGYSHQVIRASYLLSLALIPFAMCVVCEAIFQAFERMQLIVYVFGLASLIKIGLLWMLLSRGFGLMTVIGLLVVIQWAMLLMEWFFIYSHFPRFRWSIDLSFCRKLTKTALTFLGIAVFTVLFLKLNIILLSKLQGELEVGLYNAAFQFAYIFMLISMSLKQAVYPVLSRTYVTNLASFRKYAERSIEFLMCLALPMATLFFFLADSILLVYREEFVAAAPVLRILGWMVIPLSFNRILGGASLASGHQRTNLVITIVSLASHFVLSIVLIHNFGLIGAGIAALASRMISFALFYGIVSRKVFTVSIPGVTWKPVVSSLFLAGFLILLGRNGGLVILVPSAIALYCAVLIGLNFMFGGPLKSLKLTLLARRAGPEVPGTEI